MNWNKSFLLFTKLFHEWTVKRSKNKKQKIKKERVYLLHLKKKHGEIIWNGLFTIDVNNDVLHNILIEDDCAQGISQLQRK